MTYRGAFHTITGAGLNPLPVQHPIPIWMDGQADVALRRIARLADGWFPEETTAEAKEPIKRLRRYAQESGRDPDSIGIEGWVYVRDDHLDSWVRQAEQWLALGATHVSIDTMEAGFTSVNGHIEAMRRFKKAVAP